MCVLVSVVPTYSSAQLNSNISMEMVDLTEALQLVSGAFPHQISKVSVDANPSILFECKTGVPLDVLTSAREFILEEIGRKETVVKLSFRFHAESLQKALEIVSSNYGADLLRVGDNEFVIRPLVNQWSLLEFPRQDDSALWTETVSGFISKRYYADNRIFLLVSAVNRELVKRRVARTLSGVDVGVESRAEDSRAEDVIP